MAAAAVLGLLTAGITLELLRRTLIATRDAAKAAVAAARHAETAANAAVSSADADREANQLFRSNSEKELRAYLSVEPLGISQLINRIDGMGHVAVRNVGKLPARNVSVVVHMKRFHESELQTLGELQVELDKNHVERVIQPSAELRQGSDATLRLDEIEPPNNYIFVWGIAYYDGYGHRRFTRFCHRYKTDSMNVVENAHAPRTVSIIDADKGRYHETGNNAD